MEAPPGGLGRVVGALHRAWWTAAVGALVFLVGTRWLRYAGGGALVAAGDAAGLGGLPLDAWLREAMVVDGQAFLWLWAYSRLKLRMVVAVAALVVVARHRRLVAGFVARAGDRWRLRPAAISTILGGLLAVHYLLDLNPTVAAVVGGTIVLAWLLGGGAVARLVPARVCALVWVVIAGVAVLSAGDAIDRIAIVCWLALLLLSHVALGVRLGARDLALVRAAALPAMNLLPALLPMLVGVAGGTRLGDGLAYSFCEVAGRDRLYAAVPACDSVRRDWADCRGSRVVEYDADLHPVAAHEFFSPDFYGRLELLLCLDDEVQVAVQGSVYQGRSLTMSVLRFPVDAPERFTPVFLADGFGATMAWDRAHDAVFYSTEFTNRVVRWERRAGTFDDGASRDLVQIGHEPVTLDEYTGSYALHTDSIDPTRNRIYLADWMQGRYAHALDLDTRRLVARYEVGGGGSLGLAVDPERGRLYVSSLWGLDVVDLATGRVVARKRSGLGNRPVLIDAARNRLYLGSTVEGKVRVLDRDTLATLGQIPVGMGSRYLYLARDGRRLFASSAAAHWAFETAALP